MYWVNENYLMILFYVLYPTFGCFCFFSLCWILSINYYDDHKNAYAMVINISMHAFTFIYLAHMTSTK